MKNLFKVTILTILLVFISCSSDDENKKNNKLSVEIVLTEGKAANLKVVPIDEEVFFDANDVKEFEDVSKISFVLPEYTHHFELTIQGSQKRLGGYVKINGKEWEFSTLDWFYQGTYYLSDF